MNHLATTDMDRATKLSLYQIDDRCRAHAARHQAFIMALLPEAMDQFYTHITSYGAIRAFFTDAGHIVRAKHLQSQHWGLITAANFDDIYHDSVLRVGMAHYRLGLPPKLYIASYSVLMTTLGTLIHDRYAEHFPDAPASAAFQLVQDMSRLLIYDMECAITAYVDNTNSIYL
jgi:methyl-accepting chemotaxis protein